MTTAENILVVILASFLALFLVLAIVLTFKLIELAKTLKEISEKARDVVGNVEAATETLRKSAGPLAFGRLLMNIVDTVRKHGKGK